jgi:hypothetical protein
MNEVRTGIRVENAFNLRGRKKIETKLVNLKNDIKEIIIYQFPF